MQTTAVQVVDESDAEYRTIEATLLQTARGRWFLSEHGRRARRLDSALLEEAIGRLQSSLRDPPALLGQLKTEIEEVKSHLSETRAELSQRMQPEPGAAASGAPSATQGILTAAEDIHELAWSLQAKAPDAESCEQIARHAARLYALSLQQAIESARLTKLAGALDTASGKLSAVLETIAFESGAAEQAAPVPQSISSILPPPETLAASAIPPAVTTVPESEAPVAPPATADVMPS